jgi:hypothetical protein
MNISNEDIISAAKTLRTRQENRLRTPENPLKAKHGQTGWMAAAACAAGFILGFGAHYPTTNAPDSEALLTQIDSLRQEVLTARNTEPQVVREVVHDTIVTTKVVTREISREVPVVAKNEQTTDNNPINSINEQGQTVNVGCSMMCDNISYDLIASKN